MRAGSMSFRELCSGELDAAPVFSIVKYTSQVDRLRLCRIVALTLWLKTESTAAMTGFCPHVMSYPIAAQQSRRSERV